MSNGVVPTCIPNAAVLLETMRSGIGNRLAEPTRIKVLGAFDFSDHVIVTMDTTGWFGFVHSVSL